jgi:hypothetical protein
MPSLRCSQCGRDAPADRDELRGWKHGELVVVGEVDDVALTMLLCPECVEEDSSEQYEAGEPG